MSVFDFKTAVPVTTGLTDDDFFFGAASQASSVPSIYQNIALREYLLGTPTSELAIAADMTLTASVTMTLQGGDASVLSIAAGKTLTASKTLTLDGTDSTTMTFPSTSATIARTDAGQTFTGNQKLGATTARGTTEGTNHLDLFDGTAPVGTLTNGVSAYSSGGEFYTMNASGVASRLSTFLQTGTGAVARTYLAKNRDIVSSSDFNVVPDAGTDQTVVLQAALAAAAGKQLKIIPGTYLATALTGVSDIDIVGDGSGEVIIKRPDGSLTTDAILSFGSKNNFRVSGITFDGNKANQSVRAHNVVISACYQFSVDGNKSINAKQTGGGFGCGIVIVNGADAANGTASQIVGNSCYANDLIGIFVNVAQNLLVSGNKCYGNGDAGIGVGDTTIPSSPTNINIVIDGNICTFNDSGISVGGYDAETAKPIARNVVISNNICESNTSYGIVWQSIYGTIVGNTVRANGDDGTNGGVLFNASYSTLANNIIDENSYFGVDAGGCLGCVITGNVIRNNGDLALGSNGISAGSCQDTLIEGNNITLNPASLNGGGGIVVVGIDGGGAFPAFLQTGTRMVVRGNKILCSNTNQQGINVTVGNPLGFSCADNYVSGTSGNLSYLYATDSLQTSTNASYVSSSFAISLNSASTLVIPDEGDLFTVTGTTAIVNIRSYSLNAYYQKVRYVTVTDGGTSYTQGDAVSFTGGGGSGAAGTAYVVGGVIRQVVITNNGSGYSSNPTPDFSAGSGTGATGTAVAGCLNITGRDIKLVFTGALNLDYGAGGNISLSGTMDTVAGDCIVLRGNADGTWKEVCRGSVNARWHGALTAADYNFKVDAFGQVLIRDQAGIGSYGSLYVETGSDSNRGITVRGRSATQAGNLQEWQLYDATPVSYIGPDGKANLSTATLNAAIAAGTWTTSGTWTLPALTLGGTVSGGGQQLNNIIIGTSNPLAGTFTTASATDLTVTNTPRINTTPAAVGTGVKTISNAADGTTNFGHYAVINFNGTPYYFPCSATAPT